FSEGMVHAENAVGSAEAVGHPFRTIVAYWGAGYLYLRKGDLDHAIAALDRAVGLCQVWTIPTQFPRAASGLGYAYALSGQVAEGLPLLERAAAEGSMAYYSTRLLFLSEAYLVAARSADALEGAGRA